MNGEGTEGERDGQWSEGSERYRRVTDNEESLRHSPWPVEEGYRDGRRLASITQPLAVICLSLVSLPLSSYRSLLSSFLSPHVPLVFRSLRSLPPSETRGGKTRVERERKWGKEPSKVERTRGNWVSWSSLVTQSALLTSPRSLTSLHLTFRSERGTREARDEPTE